MNQQESDMLTKSAPVPPEATTDRPLFGYKAFDADLKCRGFQYEIGQTYEIPADQHPVRCGSVGFHWCENPMDIWSY